MYPLKRRGSWVPYHPLGVHKPTDGMTGLWPLMFRVADWIDDLPPFVNTIFAWLNYLACAVANVLRIAIFMVIVLWWLFNVLYVLAPDAWRNAFHAKFGPARPN